MCRQAKGTRNSFTGTVARPQVLGKQWYADVKGPFTMPSLINENKYVFGIIEGNSRYLIQYYLKEKSDEYIAPLRLTLSNPENLRHILLNTDMGECTSNATITFLRSVGIELTTTCPHTPEQNMIIERVWRSQCYSQHNCLKYIGKKPETLLATSTTAHQGPTSINMFSPYMNNIIRWNLMFCISRYLVLSVIQLSLIGLKVIIILKLYLVFS